MHSTIGILDTATGLEADHCSGPAADGSCPRVAIGAVIPCAGCTLVRSGAAGSRPYRVASRMTLCPVTLAWALAVPTDSTLIPA